MKIISLFLLLASCLYNHAHNVIEKENSDCGASLPTEEKKKDIEIDLDDLNTEELESLMVPLQEKAWYEKEFESFLSWLATFPQILDLAVKINELEQTTCKKNIMPKMCAAFVLAGDSTINSIYNALNPLTVMMIYKIYRLSRAVTRMQYPQSSSVHTQKN